MIGLECLHATAGISERSDVIPIRIPKRSKSSCNFALSAPGLTYIQHPGFLIYFKYLACMQHNMKIHAFDKLYTKGVSDKTPKEMKYFHNSVMF